MLEIVRHDGVGGDGWYWYALQWRSYRDNRTLYVAFLLHRNDAMHQSGSGRSD